MNACCLVVVTCDHRQLDSQRGNALVIFSVRHNSERKECPYVIIMGVTLVYVCSSTYQLLDDVVVPCTDYIMSGNGVLE